MTMIPAAPGTFLRFHGSDDEGLIVAWQSTEDGLHLAPVVLDDPLYAPRVHDLGPDGELPGLVVLGYNPRKAK